MDRRISLSSIRPRERIPDVAFAHLDEKETHFTRDVKTLLRPMSPSFSAMSRRVPIEQYAAETLPSRLPEGPQRLPPLSSLLCPPDYPMATTPDGQVYQASMTPRSITRSARHRDITSLWPSPDLTVKDFCGAPPISHVPKPSSHDAGDIRFTPPISPLSSPTTESESSVRADPILFPRTDFRCEAVQTCGPESTRDRMAIRNIVDQHISVRNHQMFRVVDPPDRSEYELVLTMTPNVMDRYTSDPVGWLKGARRSLLDDHRARILATPHAHKPQVPLEPAVGGQVAAAEAPGTQANSRSGPGRASLGPAAARNNTLRVMPGKPNSKSDRVSKRSSPHPHRRQGPITREDKNFREVVDYSPPLSSIPDRPDCLKSEWKGLPLDLSKHELRHLLHEEELKLAAGLRLDCATYLTSKRRIFLKRVECFENSKEFRKTDAQQACNIDVNKASRLHSAYESIGWLDPKWIIGHVEERKQQKAASAHKASLWLEKGPSSGS